MAVKMTAASAEKTGHSGARPWLTSRFGPESPITTTLLEGDLSDPFTSFAETVLDAVVYMDDRVMPADDGSVPVDLGYRKEVGVDDKTEDPIAFFE